MDDEIQLISDGDGLAVIGDPTGVVEYVDRFHQAVASRMPVVGVGSSFDLGATLGSLDQVIARAKTQTAAGRAPREAVSHAVESMLGAGQRHVLNAGRRVVAESTARNRYSLGWRRVSDGKPCAFCAMLVTRGPAYRAKATALVLHRYHDRCGCTAEEVFDHWEPTGREQEWIDAYERAGQEADATDKMRIAPSKHNKDYETEDTILYRMRSQEGGLFADSAGGSGGPGDRRAESSGDEPSWWTEENKAKVWDGLVAVRSNGQALLHGGHRSGRGWPGKTEFPPSWTRSDMEAATALAWSDPDASRTIGDRRMVRREVDGVIIEVQAYGPEHDKFRASFPVNGEAVAANTGGGVQDLPLDRSVLDEAGWTRVDR